MKRITLILISLVFAGTSFSQELFIQNKPTRSLEDTQKVNDYLKSTFCDDYYSGNVDLNVFSMDRIYVTIPGENIRAEYKLKEKNNEKWIGDAQNGEGQLIAIIDGTSIIASATFNSEIYQICSLDTELSVLAKLDQTYFAEISSCRTTEVSSGSTLKFDSDDIDSRAADITPMRVLVAYTPAAARYAYPNIVSRTKLAIEETNQSYSNSRVGQYAELAACVLVNYQEIQANNGYNTDLERFYGKSDGYMDQIHTLRNVYAADVCVLIEDIYEAGLAGIAEAIKANNSTAFCLVDYSSMVGYYSFAHEIGHLQGARHDVNVDSEMLPFSYGHGFISSNSNWRTIMGYGDACNNCKRVLYWSNPSVYYPADNMAMGTTGRENNSRVLTETASYVNGFVTTPTSSIVPGLEIKNAEYASLTARSTLSNSGNLIINPGAEVVMKSPDRIRLAPGFHAKNGSKLSISNGSVRSAALELNRANELVDYLAEKNADKEHGQTNSPAGIFNLQAFGPAERISIFNLEGIMVLDVKPVSDEIDLSHLSSGAYVLRISTSEGITIQKIHIK